MHPASLLGQGPDDTPGAQSELLAGLRGGGTTVKGFEVRLQTLGIQHGGHRQPYFRPQGLQGVQSALIRCMALSSLNIFSNVLR